MAGEVLARGAAPEGPLPTSCPPAEGGQVRSKITFRAARVRLLAGLANDLLYALRAEAGCGADVLQRLAA